MTCETALDRMLEAGPAVLRGEDGGELARHIAGCPRCARVATAILADLEAVDRALADFADARDADAAADAALAAVRRQGDGDVVPLRSRPGTTTGDASPRHAGGAGSRRAWTRRAWVPLAAAAALAAVLVLRQDEAPFPAGPAPAAPAIEPRVSVTPPADRGAAILETENPNITIVWLYEREES